MATTSISISYRPVKIGFLVREDHIEDVVKAAEINTLLWGGIYNPIIPVSTNEESAEKMINLFSVDILYPVEHTKEISGLLNKYQFLRVSYIPNRNIFYEDFYTKRNILWYLDSVNIIDLYWEKEFKHKDKEFRSNCILVEWEDNDDLKNLFSIIFGHFPSTYNLLEDFKNAFLKGLRAKEIKIPLGGILEEKLVRSIDPIRLTDAELRGSIGLLRQNGIYIGQETNFYDLVNFWNLRATGLAVQFLAKNHIARFEKFIKRHLTIIDKTPNHNPNIEDFIAFYNQFETKEELSELIKSFQTVRKILIIRCDKTAWDNMRTKPPVYYLEGGHTLANVEKSSNRYNVTISLPEKKFIANDRRNVRLQKLVVSIDPITEFEYPEHTLKPPFIRELNEFYSREISFDPSILRSEKKGIAEIIDVWQNDLSLWPLSYRRLIQGIFKLAGIDAEISQAGLITTRIIQKLGGLIGGTVFRIGGVRKLVEDLRTEDCITRGEATRIICDEGRFTKYNKSGEFELINQKLTTGGVFDDLLSKGIFRAGLELLCEHCKIRNWLPLRNLDDLWICDYCGESNQTSLHLKDRGDWRFKKSSFFARDNKQEGTIPVILTLLLFSRMFRLSGFVYSTPLNLKFDAKKCEIDFCILQYYRESGIEIGFGECKSGGGKINQDDIDNLKSIREKLSAIGMDCYLIFSKSAEQFEPDEVDLFKTLSNEDVPLILLTNRELEPHFPYLNRGGEAVPKEYVHTLGDMSLNSEYLYLKSNRR